MVHKDDDGKWHVDRDKLMSGEGKNIIEEIKARTAGNSNGGVNGDDIGHDIAKNTKEAIDLKKAEGSIEIALTRATESSKEVAGKHLAKMGAFYLLVLVLSFIYSVQSLPNEAIAVVAGLITLVVSNLSQILKGITEDKDVKDPIELMYDIAEKNSDICEREMAVQAEATQLQVAAITAAAERQTSKLSESAERQVHAMVTAHANSHSEMVAMLQDALQKQPTSLNIQPDNVVITQGDNIVETSNSSGGKPTI